MREYYDKVEKDTGRHANSQPMRDGEAKRKPMRDRGKEAADEKWRGKRWRQLWACK